VRLPTAGFDLPTATPPSATAPAAAVDLSLEPGDAGAEELTGPASADAADAPADRGLFDSPYGFALIPVTFALGRVSKALRARR
jgi:hypothetical protein